MKRSPHGVRAESTLDSLRPGEHGVIDRVTRSPGGHRKRLLEMGLIHGTTVLVVRYAPLGDPIEIELNNGSRLSLRRREAEAVIVHMSGK